MTEPTTPDPGPARVIPDRNKPNAVVLPRTTVALTVGAILVTLGGLVALNASSGARAEAAREQSVSNEALVEELRGEARRSDELAEKGFDCMVALIVEEQVNTTEAARASAEAHGYELGRLDAVELPDLPQREYIQAACTRFFAAQAEVNPDSPDNP